MDSFEQDGNGTTDGGSTLDALPPPPPVIPPDVVPLRAEPEPLAEPVKKKVLRIPIARRGPGSKGQKIPLVTNHFKVSVTNVEGHFFHYSVCFYISLI
jgi:eukaryotic translation initiation factor 2C